MAMAMGVHAAAGVDVRLSGAGELVESEKGLTTGVRLLQQRTGSDLAMRQTFATRCSLEQGLTLGLPPRRSVRVRAAKGATSDGVRWWEKDGGANFHDVHSMQEFVEALSNTGDKLVVVEFYASWCGSCRALYPKLCRLAAEHLDVEFRKVNFEDNKPMCKSLNIKVLPYFHFYRGSEGLLEGFSCSLSKLSKLREAIALHNTERGGDVNLDIATSKDQASNDQAAPATASP